VKEVVVSQPAPGHRARRKATRKSRLKQIHQQTPMRVIAPLDVQAIKATYGQELAVPRNDMDRLTTLVNAGGNDKIRGYVAAIVNPANAFDARVIDSFNTPTATFHSRRTINVSVRLDAGTDSGRFCMLFQPFLGANDAPEHYQLALSNPSIPWPTDWTKANSYVGVVSGSDVRLDVNYAQLTAQGPGFTGLYPELPAIDTAFPFDLFNVDVSSYNVVVNSDSTTHRLYPPVGQFMMWFTAHTTTNAGTEQFTFSAFDGCTIVWYDNGGPVTGADIGTYATLLVTNTVSGGYFMIENTSSVLQPTWADMALFLATVQVNLPYGTAFSPNPGVVINSPPYPGFAGGGGLISSYRPVAASLLASYVGPMLTNGGNIAAAWLPSNATTQNFFTRTPGQYGNFQNWEKLADVPTAYNGPINTGAYCYWTPEDMTDVEMASLSEALEKDYPTLCISGQFNPGTAVTDPTEELVIRLQLDYCGEYVTTSTLVPSRACVGSQQIWDQANMVLANQPHAMPNGKHLEFFKKIAAKIGTAAKWAWNNRATLMAGAEGLAAIL